MAQKLKHVRPVSRYPGSPIPLALAEDITQRGSRSTTFESTTAAGVPVGTNQVRNTESCHRDKPAASRSKCLFAGQIDVGLTVFEADGIEKM